MRATLYWFPESNPCQSVRLMLERKRIPHELRSLTPGLHPLQVRLAGFRGPTVPALRLDGRRAQGSREISRMLEAAVPEPPLFPPSGSAREAVIEAERWGEQELQPVSGRIFHRALVDDPGLRRWLAAEVIGLPAPAVAARAIKPIARLFSRDAPPEAVRADLEALPALLDHVDALIADGTIGREPPNAADMQIATTVRELLSFEALAPYVRARPAARLALRILPDWDACPLRLPHWLGPPAA